jgi:hypothetical protein
MPLPTGILGGDRRNPPVSSQTFSLPAPCSEPWIISRGQDLTWFICSSLVSYAVLALMAAGFPLTPLFVIWLVGIDGPHVLATVTRTYFDSVERRKLGSLLWVVLPAMAIGPMLVAAGAESVFYVLALTWLHYHIAKQHFGFVMLYKHKARERDRTDFVLDRWFLLASLMLPFARFAARTFYPNLLAWPPAHHLEIFLLAGYGGLAGAFLLRQLHKWKNGTPLNRPKLMLLAAVVPLQWLAFGYATANAADGIVRAGIVVGLFHSFQYHRLMWFHNRNRYSEPEAENTVGLAAILARRAVYYFAAAVLLNLCLSILPGSFSPSPYLKAALWGIPFTHYILDSVIWRVRGNKELATALRLS